MKKLEFICDNLNEIHTVDSIFSYYKNNYTWIIHNININELLNRLNHQDKNYPVLLALYVGALFVRRDFIKIQDILKDFNFNGDNRHMDYFIAKLVKYFYSTLKYTKGNMNIIYLLLATNKEYGNNDTIGVLTNCIMDWEIGMGIFDPLYISCPMISSNDNAKYNFYHGIIAMVLGNYNLAFHYFEEADIQQCNKKIALAVQKHHIICNLLLGNFEIHCHYLKELEPYFELIRCVKRGELAIFYSILNKHKSEYFSMNLWFIIRRLVKNLLREGVRKISMCYTQISICEISHILGTDALVLLEEALENKFINGYVENGIYHAGNLKEGFDLNYSTNIREIIKVENSIQKMMKYPEITPLTYEQLFPLLNVFF